MKSDQKSVIYHCQSACYIDGIVNSFYTCLLMQIVLNVEAFMRMFKFIHIKT